MSELVLAFEHITMFLVRFVPAPHAICCKVGAPVEFLLIYLIVLGFASLGLNKLPGVLLALYCSLPVFLILVISLGILGIPPFQLALPPLLDLFELIAKLVANLEATLEFFKLC